MANLSNIIIETEDGIPLLFNYVIKDGEDGEQLVLQIPNLQFEKADTKREFFKKDYTTDNPILKQLHTAYLKELETFNECETCKMSSLKSKFNSLIEKLA